MVYTIWRGSQLLGSVEPLPEDDQPNDQQGSGKLVAECVPDDLAGSMQMRTQTPAGSAVLQFSSPQVDIDAIRASGASSSGVKRVPGRLLDAMTAAPMRDEWILSVRDATGRTLDLQMVSLSEMLAPASYAQATGIDRRLWLVGWVGR